MLILLFRNVWLNQEKEINNSDNKTSIVKQGIGYINEHYDEDIKIDDICATVGVSKYHFCRIFKEVTQKTVNEYTLSLRVQQARFLLKEKNTVFQKLQKQLDLIVSLIFQSVIRKVRCFTIKRKIYIIKKQPHKFYLM